MTFIGILDSIQEDLQRVEAVMRTLPQVDYEIVEEAVNQLLDSGGKRIRPSLTVLACRLYPTHDDRMILLAAATELLHTATLVHDDMIDGSLMRRGSPTLNATWTPGVTVLVGDYLFARAADLAARTDNVRVMQIFARTLMTIVTGELHQMLSESDARILREDYERRIYAKTASMFELATEAAGVLVGAPTDQVMALKDFGRDLGIAFQIIDDVLDFIGDASEVGKPVGSDLHQGIVTLPVIHYIDAHPEDERLQKLLHNGYRDEQLVHSLVKAVQDSDAIASAVEEAREYVRRSQRALSYLPENDVRQSLWDIADYVVTRTS